MEPDRGTGGNGVCWQCGAPADDACISIRKLSIAKSRHGDGQGFPVLRGWQNDTVRIPVPRCARCQARNVIVALTIGASTMIGAIIGGTAFPSRGWTTILGGFATLLPLWLALRLYKKAAGLHSVDDHPAVKRLRKAGWSDPV